jgi:DNA-binding PadR family transcriptional regulator
VKSRRDSLTFILLGLLTQSSLHGYELRKRITAIYGSFRALSFGVIYPQLRRMLADGLIKERVINKSQRSRIEYSITDKGERVFAELNDSISEASWDDEGFEARFAFFTATTKRNRIKILEGRLLRIQQKVKMLESEPKSTLKNLDKYLEEWRGHALESAEREIAWLEKLIKAERK